MERKKTVHKTGLVIVHGKVFKDGSNSFAIFKMEPFATIGNGRAYNWCTEFACCCNNLIIFTGKIKIRCKWSYLEGNIRYTFLFCRHAFTFFWKCWSFSVSLTLCFISKINYKNENRYHCWLHLSRFYNQKQLSTYVLKNVVNKMRRKHICEGVLFSKIKDLINILIHIKF